MPGAECLCSDVAKGFGMDNSPTAAIVKTTASLAGASNANDEHIPLFPKYPPPLWFFKIYQNILGTMGTRSKNAGFTVRRILGDDKKPLFMRLSQMSHLEKTFWEQENPHK